MALIEIHSLFSLCVLGGFARNILRGRVSRKDAKDAKEGDSELTHSIPR